MAKQNTQPILRHKAALKNLGKSRTEEEMFIAQGYSPSYARSGQIKKTKAWQALMEKEFPDGFLARKHRALLEKTETRVVKTEEDGKIVERVVEQPETLAVSRGLEMAYKLKGRFEIGPGNDNRIFNIVITRDKADRLRSRLAGEEVTE